MSSGASGVFVRHIYLDYNATTPIAPGVQQAMTPFLIDHFGDPSARHALGRAAGEAVEDARGRVAGLLGADRDEITFTSGGTESNLLALVGTLFARKEPACHVVISAVEHASVIGAAALLERLGHEVTMAPANGQGVVTATALHKVIRPNTALVSIQHANHETGVVQPLRQLAAVCRDLEVPLHTDASQSIGKLRTLVDELEVDLLTLSGHKVYGPKGIGALYVRAGTAIDPILQGGGQESGLRPGMENVAGIVGLGRACELTLRCLDDVQPRMEELRNRLETKLTEGTDGDLTIHGGLSTRLPNTSCLSFPGVNAHEMLERIPELCVATNVASFATTAVISGTLSAMGVANDTARGTLRVSLGWYTEEDEIDRAAELLLDAWESLR